MNKLALVPSGISSLRLAALPIFLYFYTAGNPLACILVFGFSQATDLIDGYVARKLHVASKAGAYFDAAVDFIFISGIFTAFTLSGYYPVWILALIAASFAQFIISSRFTTKLYDPLGKYIGSVLYIAIGLTLLSPTPLVFTIVEVGFSTFAITSFVTRTASYASKTQLATLLKNCCRQPAKVQAAKLNNSVVTNS
jgi:phosphatidylglycerophosphate synthase